MLPTLPPDHKYIDPQQVKRVALIQSKNGSWYIYCLVNGDPCYFVASDALLAWLKDSDISFMTVTTDWKQAILSVEKINEDDLTLAHCKNAPAIDLTQSSKPRG